MLSPNPVIGQLVSGNSWARWTSPNRLERVVAALQCVCWLSEYAGRAMMLMAQLSWFDCSREEVEYIADQFARVMVGHDRISVIREEDARYVMLWVLDNCPKLYDLLVNRVLVRDFWYTSSYVPVYHDWVLNGTSSDEALSAERQKDMLGVFVNYLEENTQGWLRVLHLLERLEQSPSDYLLDSFKECYLDGRFDADQQFECWLYLHALKLDCYLRHRRDGTVIWGGYKTLTELVKLLEPVADPRRFAWLFGRPERLCVRGLICKDEAFWETLKNERESALGMVMRDNGQGLRALAEVSPNSEYIGECLAGMASSIDSIILSWLDDGSAALVSVACSYVRHKAWEAGIPWVRELLNGNGFSEEAKSSFVASLPCNAAICELVKDFELGLRVVFWQHVNVFEIEMQQRGCVLDVLLEHGCVAQAIDLVTLMLSSEQNPSVAHVVRVLLGLLAAVERRDRCVVSSDVVNDLFVFLESAAPDHAELPMLELLFSCHGFYLDSLCALYRHFERNPDCFAELVISVESAEIDFDDSFDIVMRQGFSR